MGGGRGCSGTELGVFDLAGLDAGVDEEADADAEGDEADGGSGEDVALLKDGGKGDEEEDEADGSAAENDASLTRVGAAAEGVGSGLAAALEDGTDGDFVGGGRRGHASGDGGEAFLALHLAAAGAGPGLEADDAEHHETGGNGNDEGAVGDVAEGGEGFENHGELL